MRVIKKYGLSILFCAIILVLCFISTKPLPKVPISNFDKMVHLIMFLGLSGVVFFDNTLYLKNRISYWRIVFGSFLFPTLFSGLVELMQEYFPIDRTGDWMDFLFDAIGSFIGLAICMTINTWLKKSKAAEK
ncbi:MAG: VanZ family protein [Dysgonamonadaceae bacterium]|jgi:VanZ family protein|nr:VanZ family protein [Dysgonamonadaceae bacterium]